MGEDFEIRDSCPKCGSRKVTSQWDDLGLIRVYLSCKNCMYLEIRNDGHCEEEDPVEEWQSDPDEWKI